MRQITDYRRITPFDRDVRGRLRQGPIQPGGYLVLGSFLDIILGDQGDPEQGERDADAFDGFEKLQICVAVLHGPSKNHVGARREFTITRENDSVLIHGADIHTEQLVSRAKRAEVRQWVQEAG